MRCPLSAPRNMIVNAPHRGFVSPTCPTRGRPEGGWGMVVRFTCPPEKFYRRKSGAAMVGFSAKGEVCRFLMFGRAAAPPPLHTSPPVLPVTSRKRKEKIGNGGKDDHWHRDGAFHHRRAGFSESQEQKVKQNTQTGGNSMPPVFYAKSKEE